MGFPVRRNWGEGGIKEGEKGGGDEEGEADGDRGGRGRGGRREFLIPGSACALAVHMESMMFSSCPGDSF